jgi:ABC-type polysaccharide/polyol phosphate export permease
MSNSRSRTARIAIAIGNSLIGTMLAFGIIALISRTTSAFIGMGLIIGALAIFCIEIGIIVATEIDKKLSEEE